MAGDATISVESRQLGWLAVRQSPAGKNVSREHSWDPLSGND
jgi:hypothetical protein